MEKPCEGGLRGQLLSKVVAPPWTPFAITSLGLQPPDHELASAHRASSTRQCPRAMLIHYSPVEANEHLRDMLDANLCSHLLRPPGYAENYPAKSLDGRDS